MKTWLPQKSIANRREFAQNSLIQNPRHDRHTRRPPVRFCTALGFSFALALVVTTGSARICPAQPPAAPVENPKTPAELFKQAREEIRDGRFDVAAETLKKFLAGNPTEKDLLDITKNEPTAFLKLRNVPVWSDNATAQTEAKKLVEDIIAKAEEANKKLYADPARIAKFTRNLGETLEERLYAEQQLKLSGDGVAPVMIDALRTTSDVNLRAGIYSAITKLNPEQLPGFVAALSGVDSDLKLGILRSLVARADANTLTGSADTDVLPHLWYYSSDKAPENAALKSFASEVLTTLTGGLFPRKQATAEIVKLSQPFVAKQSRFRSGEKVKIWSWDAGKQTLTSTEASRIQANDYFGIRNLKWALERSPNDIAAQEAFLTMTVERAVEKAQFGDLAAADPALFQILATAPSETLIGLLDRAMLQKNSALALGLTQVLALRSDKTAATSSSATKPAVLVKALDYPDNRVQLAAAIGLLRVPSANHGQASKVVEILRRAASVEASGAKEMGRAIIADPNDNRADKLASQLRSLGYTVERYVSGRELTLRLNRAADADMVFVDRHVVNPELRDLMTQIRPVLASRPLYVVASTNSPKAVPFNQLLLRLAVLIAVTETSSTEVPAPFFFDPRKPVPDVAKTKTDTASSRDKQLDVLYRLRLGRLERLVSTAGLPQSTLLQNRLAQRLPQLTYAALAAEYPITPDSSPETYKAFDAKTRTLLANPQLAGMTDNLPQEGIKRLLEEMESAITPAKREMADQMLARLDPVILGLAVDNSRDAVLEDQMQKITRGLAGVHVISESYTASSLAEEIRQTAADPAQLPASAADKKRGAKVAVEYLRRIATGEIPGYDVRPAEAALRSALRDDDLADNAIDAVFRIPTLESQQDLLALALTGAKPAAIRIKATERTILHIQNYGKLIPSNLLDALQKTIDMEPNPEIKTRLAVVQQLLIGKPDDLGNVMLKFPLPLPKPVAPPMPKEAAPPAAEAEKKPN
jgi:CheY-like chemotaxis protein